MPHAYNRQAVSAQTWGTGTSPAPLRTGGEGSSSSATAFRYSLINGSVILLAWL